MYKSDHILLNTTENTTNMINRNGHIYTVLSVGIIFIIVSINIKKNRGLFQEKKVNGPNLQKKINFTHVDIQNRNQSSRQKIVIIWTTIRSGSNFLRTILGHMPNTFILNEPIHYWQNQEFHKRNTSYEIGQYFQATNSTLLSAIMNFYLDILHCKIAKYPGPWQKIQLNLQYNHMRDYFCKFCHDIKKMDVHCEGSKLILHKIVSIGLSNAWQILEDPDLDVRILHLVRDPRGNLASRHNLPAFILQNMKKFDSKSLKAKNHCSNIQEDLLEAKRLKLQYPNRYMLVRYEDLMTSGIGKLVRWLDIENPLSIASAYASRTIIPYEMSSQFHPFSTLKISDQVWQRWRVTGSFSWVQDVQSSCALVLDKLGYRQYNNLQNYKNMSLQPILPIP